MAALSTTMKFQLFCATLAVILLFGCEKRPEVALSESENMSSTAQDVSPNPVLAPPLSRQQITSSVPQSSRDGEAKPADDSQASMKRIRARLEENFENTSTGQNDIAKLRSAWNETWHTAFDVMLDSASAPAVVSGQVVPPEILAHLKDTALYAESLSNDEAGFVSDRMEFEAAYALTLIATSACLGSGAELPAFLNRAGTLPPTKGDVVIFRALGDGLLYLEHPAVLNDSQFNGWLQLITARNPIYRLIAARTFNSVSSDLGQKSVVYRQLLNDTDPVITRIAVIGATRNVTDETSTALSEFRDRQKKLGNAELVDVASKALERIEKRP